MVVGLVVEHGNRQTAKAEVDRALHLVGGTDSGAGFHIVSGADDRHTGDAAHEGKVLTALVGSAVLAHRDAAVGGTDLDVEVRVADGVADLLKRAARGKHGKAGNKGDIAHGGQACSHTHHIALGNAAVKVAAGVSLAEHARLGGSSQIRVQHHQLIVALGGQLFQGIAVTVTGCDLLHFCHLTCPPLPARRRLRSAPAWRWHTRHRWGPCRANPRSSP